VKETRPNRSPKQSPLFRSSTTFVPDAKRTRAKEGKAPSPQMRHPLPGKTQGNPPSQTIHTEDNRRGACSSATPRLPATKSLRLEGNVTHIFGQSSSWPRNRRCRCFLWSGSQPTVTSSAKNLSRPRNCHFDASSGSGHGGSLSTAASGGGAQEGLLPSTGGSSAGWCCICCSCGV